MKNYWVVLALLLTGCAAWGRSCTAFTAESFGSNWVIVQFGINGKPFNCWKLHDVSVVNEQGSDGVYWKDSDGHLIHISGWYNRVQVNGGDFTRAAHAIGVDIAECSDGRYPDHDPASLGR